MPIDRGLQKVIDLLEKDIRERVPDVSFVYGKGEISKHGPPPRVAWLPSEGALDKYAPADFQDHESLKAIALDRAGLEVHCWAKADERGRDSLAERLGHIVIASIHRISGRGYTLGAVIRDTNENPSAQGWLYIFHVQIHIPVLDDEWVTATLTDLPFDTSQSAPEGVLQAPGDS